MKLHVWQILTQSLKLQLMVQHGSTECIIFFKLIDWKDIQTRTTIFIHVLKEIIAEEQTRP